MTSPTITVSTVTDGPRRLVRIACTRPDGAEIDIDLAPDQARQLGGQLIAEAFEAVVGEV